MEKGTLPSSKVMVALDNMDYNQVIEFCEKLPAECPWVKIGLEQFLKNGKDLVKLVHDRFEKKIFLDLKLHDIPNTVSKAMESLSDLPISFLTVHLGGGRSMLEACQSVRSKKMAHTNILGVSFLTSLDKSDLSEIYGIGPNEDNRAFKRLFKLALETGTQGIVCSPFEVPLVQDCEKEQNKEIIKVCPGVRFSDEIGKGAIGDQKRVLSPQEAFQKGADYLVMGRSLTQTPHLKERIGQLNSI